MKINAIITNNTNYYKSSYVNFKAALFEEYECGIDGNPYGIKTRDFLRERLYAQALMPREIKNPINCDNANNIKEVYIANFRDLGNASYSGENLMHHPEYFRLLKPSGITRVIDLTDTPGLKEKCEEFGLDYYMYNAKDGYAGHDIFFKEDLKLFTESQKLAKEGLSKDKYNKTLEKYKTKIEEEKKQTIVKIKEFIDIVDQGGFYMSCEEGDFRTTSCLALVSTLNPNWKGEKIKAGSAYTLKLRELYKNLTAKHKQILEIDEEYDKYLKEYFELLMKKMSFRSAIIK